VSHVFETRCVSARLTDPIGVARVACIGDSMMFGAGGLSRDALPAQLGRILNQAYPEHLVFVDNFGETSGNIWDAWPLFKIRAQAMRFDAVVFSVCQNDLDLFATHQVPYGGDQLANFAEDAPQLAAGVELFGDVAAWREASGIDVLVIFYSFHPLDRPKIDRLAPFIASLGLPFIDMLGYFTNETALTIHTYRVSEFDGHPSPMGHEFAARRVAREFRAARFLTRAPKLGQEVGASLAAAVRAMIDQGVTADCAMLWALEAVGAKKASAQRRGALAGNAGLAAIWDELEATSGEALTALRHGARRRVRSALIEEEWPPLEGYFNNLFAYRRRLQSVVSVLTEARPGQDLAAQAALLPDTAFLEGGQGGRAVAFDGDLAALASHWRQRIDAAMAALGLARPPGVVGDRTVGGMLPARLVDPLAEANAAESIIGEQISLIARQVDFLEDYAERAGPTIAAETPEHRLLVAIAVDLRSAFVYIDRFIPMLEAKLPLAAPDGLPWTVVEVAIEGAVGAEVSDRTFDLIVELTYTEPAGGIIRDRQLAGAVKDRAVYRFEFPLMLRGEIRVRVPERGVNRDLFTSGRARFSAIKVGNADWNMEIPQGGKIVEWEAAAEPCDEVRLSDVILS